MMVLVFASVAASQSIDPAARLFASVAAETHNKLKLAFESRGRYEIRNGMAFGREPDLATGLIRTRLGAALTPVSWLKIFGMVQDARAPWYGPGAPNTVRDAADLHEGYIELFPDYKTGFGMTIGRMMLNYGDARLIGSPQWGNLARTYDHVRLYHRSPRAQLELLLVSPVKIRPTEFNRPVLGDRIWGTYNVFPNFYRKHQMDIYVLRHDQNRPGGFTGPGRLEVNTFGSRITGPLLLRANYTLEMALQTGKVGPAAHRAGAWFSSVSRRWRPGGRALDISGEYKYASGTDDPQKPARSHTFDQLYPANHDKFGHEDLFGWRNIHNTRWVASLAVTSALSVTFMYDNSWLASPRDAVYNGAGRPIVRSATGTVGRHIGQEADLFATWRYRHFMLGAGYGRFFSGEFIRRTTPGVGPTYLYIFHTYSL